MGASASATLLDYRYQNERKELRKQLMLKFEQDPSSQDLLQKVNLVRKIVTEHPELCRTANIELKNVEEINITGVQAAYSELDRLLTIYETSTILKSVQCRIGTIACPLGHYAPYYEDFSCLVEGKNKIICNICSKPSTNGHHCGYCFYSLCMPCSAVYCDHGHTMKLWTHPESQHSCFICKKQPVTSGYRCLECEDYDFCDYCTRLDGRNHIRKIIHDRMAVDLDYIEHHQEESVTAKKTLITHKKKVQEGAYATIKDLYEFADSLHQIKIICVAEVRQTRITNAIIKLRSVLVVGKEFSKTAYEESLQVDNYTQEELDRLEKLYHCHEYLKSVVLRSKTIVSCPLGHACSIFEGMPDQYRKRLPEPCTPTTPYRPLVVLTHSESKKSKKINIKQKDSNVYCRICSLIALKGFHCDYCEYDLCMNCTNIYCAEGHEMKMWTEPSSLEKCFLCSAEPITCGYRCSVCPSDLCDMCTTKENREKIRTNWEDEMNTLLGFMQQNKRLSDIALYYDWRHQNQLNAMGRLVDYVHELRTAKKRAILQIEQKPFIDKIKLLRQEICKHGDLCVTAAKEIDRNEVFVFPTQEKAVEELKRLAHIVREMIMAKTAERRAAAGIACPLAHAMIPIVMESDVEILGMEVITANANTATQSLSTRRSETDSPTTDLVPQTNNSSSINFEQSASQKDNELVKIPTTAKKFEVINNTNTPSSSKKYEISVGKSDPTDDNRLSGIKAAKQKLLANIQDAMNSVATDHYDPMFGPKRMCKICATENLNHGHTCTICEYDLCMDCSVIFCREGHPVKIWTMPDADTLQCDICKAASIRTGYRCTVCNTDICDMCTTRDSRNAFALWPRREFHRVYKSLEAISAESTIAKNYLQELQSGDKSYLEAMSKLCVKLREIEAVKVRAEEEVKQKIHTKKAKSYGFKAKDMI